MTAVIGAGRGVAGLLFNDAVSTVVVFNFEFDDGIVTFWLLYVESTEVTYRWRFTPTPSF